MYLNYYKLKKEPFNITPDPEFLFLSPAHKEALAAVIYGVQQRKGFIAIVGEVGVGKTTVLRSYLDRIDRKVLRPIYLFNANISFENLLKVMFRELGLKSPSENSCDMVSRLHEYLIAEYAQGHNIVLIIDEAQNMPVATLENLRTLSNLETTKEKLVQIVFSAQPEFEQMLAGKELRQLRQRIAVKTTIRPLDMEESLAYIKHRLDKAVAGTRSIFTPGAMKLIASHAEGIPRTINILCDNSLVSSYGCKRQTVNERTVREIMADFTSSGKVPAQRWRTAAAVTVSLCCTVGISIFAAPLLFKGEPAQRVESGRLDTPLPQKRELNQPAPPAEASRPVTEQAVPALSGEKDAALSLTVKRGDTLAKLIQDKYGYVNRRAIESVKQHNPTIKDENKIIEGERIIFPQRGK